MNLLDLLISKNIKKKIDEEFVKVKFKFDLDKLIKNNLIISIFLAVIVEFIFKEKIISSSSTEISIIIYYLISYIISIILIFIFVYMSLTLRKVKRKKEMENSLADYLQLVASNLNAGMPIDQALEYAVRDRFGALAEDMELVARKVMTGYDIEKALIELSKKYDSDILNKSMILLVEGIKSGGELSSLVNKIAWNIKETQLLEKEISAETTTYTIFIIFASIIAAPALYALSHRIILIMNQVTSKIDISAISGISSSIPLTIGAQIISEVDFKTFAIINLIVTCAISATLVSKIKKGSAKAGLRLIPIFIFIGVILFYLVIKILEKLFANLLI